MSTYQFNEDDPCLYCGCPDAHACDGVAVCDVCCIDQSDIVIAYPAAETFFTRIIEYRIHGRPRPAPEHSWARRPQGFR